ncbi:MAG: DMT family transporter [Gemmatimonadota bacterium]
MVHVVLLVVQVLLASLAISAKLALEELPPAGLVLLRVVGAALTLGLLLRRRLLVLQSARDGWRLALYSLLGVVLNQLLYMQGLSYTTAINANLLITTVPVFTLAIALLLRRERATRAGIAGLTLSLVGALVLIGPGGVDLGPRYALGNAMILLNALSYAAYLVLSKDMLRRYPPLTVTAWVFLFGVVGVLPVGLPALLGVDLIALSTRTWLLVVFIVLVPTAAAYGLSLWALQRADSSVVAMYVYVQPLVTALIAPGVLGERIGWEAVVAAVAIFGGVALVTLSRRERSPREALRETRV